MRERLDLLKREAQLESVDAVPTRSLSSFAYTKAIAMVKLAFFAPGSRSTEVDPAYTSLIGAVNRVPSWHRFLPGHRLVPLPGEGWQSPKARWGERQWCVLANGGRVSFAQSPSNRTNHGWSFAWWGFGRDLKRRIQRMPCREAMDGLARLRRAKTRGWALPGLCR